MKNDLTKKEQNLPTTYIPLGRGHESHCDQEDYEIPRAKLIQSTSEEATADNPNDRVGIGKIINSITKKELPSTFILVIKYPNNYIQWNPRKKDDPNFDPAYDPGQLVFSTTDPNDPRVVAGKVFGPNGEAPKVTKYLNFLAYFPGDAFPVVVSFAKSSFGAGKKLNSLARLAGGDLFSNKYTLKSVSRESSGTKYFVFDVSPAGKATEAEFKNAEVLYEEFKTKPVTVHQINEDEVYVDKKNQEKFED